MIKFDLKNVMRRHKSPDALMDTLYHICFTPVSTACKMKVGSFGLGNKSGYVDNVPALLASPASNKHRYEYFVLAGKRNIADRAMLGINYLDLDLWPNIRVEDIDKNPLLKREGLKVFFTLENNVD